MLRGLLGATNASTWAFVEKTHPTPGFIPEVVMPAEGQILAQLDNDPAVSGHLSESYRLHADPDSTGGTEWITTGPFETTEGSLTKNFITGVVNERTTESKQIMAWVRTDASKSANFQQYDYTYFNNHLLIAGIPAVASLEKLDDPKETAAFSTVGLDGIRSGADAYQKPLLPVLDAIKDSRDGSPIFRAYLFLRVMDLMKLQPDAWGLLFCPAARKGARGPKAYPEHCRWGGQ